MKGVSFMMKYLQRLGKSLMLPVAALPVAAILMGIGYWIDPTGWGANSMFSAILLKAGGALIDNMSWLFAVGVAVGMSKDNDGTAGLAGLVSFLTLTTILSTGAVAFYQGVGVESVPAAFGKINTQFTGILSGLIGGAVYNKFHNVRLHPALAFFSGKRSVAIMTSLITLLVCVPMYLLWPVIYGALVKFGESIISLGPLGAGIYAFFNRLLIPFGLHHALNSVFWFDVANINDIGRFWGPDLTPFTDVVTGIASSGAGAGTSVTGIYMTGFFPVMMFGLPGAALAMYVTAKENKKKIAAGLLFAAALSSFFTGVTEPLEFAFMFLAPGLYVIHALLTGISAVVTALLPVRAGFNFSAGFVDWFLSFKAPGAVNPWMIIPIGLVVGVLYFAIFYGVIRAFNLKTPGREDDEIEGETSLVLANDNFTEVAAAVLEAVGGKDNIASVDNCVTRLRLEVKDNLLVDEKKIKQAGAAGVIRPSKTAVQVIIGTQVQFVADEFKKLLNK